MIENAASNYLSPHFPLPNLHNDQTRKTSEERMNNYSYDSFYDRTRSKKVELLSNVFDHASKRANIKEYMFCSHWH